MAFQRLKFYRKASIECEDARQTARIEELRKQGEAIANEKAKARAKAEAEEMVDKCESCPNKELCEALAFLIAFTL